MHGHLAGGLLRHHGKLGPAGEKPDVGLAELVGWAGSNEVAKDLFFEVSKVVRWSNSVVWDAVGEGVEGGVGLAAFSGHFRLLLRDSRAIYVRIRPIRQREIPSKKFQKRGVLGT